MTSFFYFILFMPLLFLIFYDKRVNKYLALLLFFVLCVVFGSRVGIGPDYYNYERVYNALSIGHGNMYDHVISKFEFGYLILNKIFIELGFDYQGLVFFVFSITFFIYIAAGSKHVKNYALILFFLFSTGVIANSMNLYRQSLAIAIVYFSLKFMFEKKYFTFFLIVCFASSFHITALIALSFPFLYKIKVTIRNIAWLLLCSVVFFLVSFKINILPLLYNVLPIPNSYSVYFLNNEWEKVGLGIRNYIEIGYVFVVLFFLKLNTMDENDKFIVFIFLLGIMLSLALSNLGVFSRVAMLFYYTSYMAIPIIIRNIHSVRIKQVLTFLIVIFNALLYFRIATSENYIPYCFSLLGKLQCLY